MLYQLLACGINVIASFDSGLQKEFADRILYVNNLNEAYYLLDKLYKDSDYRDRLSLLGQRFIFEGNTYTDRIEAMLDKLEYHNLKLSKPGVSIVCCTHMEMYMSNILENYHRQKYDKKELIIILNDPDMDKGLWVEKAKQYSNVRIIQPNRKTSVGYCVNRAVENACYEYIANFDHDDYYGPEYIGDSINAFKYTSAGLVGKKTHFVYYEGSKTLALMLPGYENKYVVNIDGSSIVFKKEIFSKVHFIDRLFADIQFSLDCWNNGIKVYSCDKYNHIYMRSVSKEHHAFKLSDDDFKALTHTIKESIDDYQAFAKV
ncbi:MAG: glycosyltransferase [Pseudomonadota bacterium]